MFFEQDFDQYKNTKYVTVSLNVFVFPFFPASHLGISRGMGNP
jgi:hypothetical protein